MGDLCITRGGKAYFVCLLAVLFSGVVSAGQIETISQTFTTSDQGLWGSGPSTPQDWSHFYGTTWNATYSSSTISYHWYGDYGAKASITFAGKAGVTIDAQASGGSINASMTPTVTLTLPDQINAGQAIPVTTQLTNLTMGFTTQSPSIGFGITANFQATTKVSGTVCVVGCVNLGTADLLPPINWNPPILSINQNNDNQIKVFGLNVTNAVVNSISASPIGDCSLFSDWNKLCSNVVTLAYDPATLENVDWNHIAKATSFPHFSQITPQQWLTSMGSQNQILPTFSSTAVYDPQSLTASASAGSNVLDVKLDETNAIAKALGLPFGFNGTIKLGPVKLGSWNLATVDTELGLGWGEDYSMKWQGADLVLYVSEDGKLAETFTLPVSQAATTEDLYLDPALFPPSEDITIVPEIVPKDPLFKDTDLLAISVKQDASLFGGSLLGWKFGPMYEAHAGFTVGIPLTSQQFDLGGFSSSIPGTAVNLVIGPPVLSAGPPISGTGEIRLNAGEYTVVDLTTTGNSSFAAGAVLTGDPLTNQGTLSLNGVQISGISISNSGQLISSVGSNTFTNVSLDNSGNIAVNANSSLIMANSTLNNTGSVTLTDPTSQLLLTATAINGGTLNIDSGSLVASGGSAVNVDKIAFASGGSMSVSSSSVTAATLIGGTINVYNGILEIGSLVSGTAPSVLDSIQVDATDGSPGTVILHGQVSGGAITLNGPNAQLALGQVNVSGLTVVSDAGTVVAGSIPGEASAMVSDSLFHLSDGSALGVQPGGTLTLQHATVLAIDSTVVNGGSLVLSGSTFVFNGGSGLQNAGSLQVAVDPGGIATTFQSDGYLPDVDNAGQILVNGTLLLGRSNPDAAVLLNEGGTVEVTWGGFLGLTEGGATETPAPYIQTSGSTIVDQGAVVALVGSDGSYQTMLIVGGTLAGQGQIQGDVVMGGTLNLVAGQHALEVAGAYTQLSSGVLDLSLDGLLGMDDPELQIDGIASVEGQLVLEGTLPQEASDGSLPGYDPDNPWVFQILSCGNTCTGEFQSLDALDIDNYYWKILYGSNSISIELLLWPFQANGQQPDLSQIPDFSQFPAADLMQGQPVQLDGGQFVLLGAGGTLVQMTPEPGTLWLMSLAGAVVLMKWAGRLGRAKR